MISIEEYMQHDGLGLAELVRKKEVTAAELLDAAIQRADAVNPKINAIVRPLHEPARRRVSQPLEGPFAGVPFLLKDLINELAGVPTTQGSAFFMDYTPQQDTELVRRYQAAGLVIFGKTNTPELGLTPWTEPALFGPARNPWNLAHTPGGSSGGSAAAVAAGIVPMANGGDGGGSIRVPAAACGLVGLKPTRGRIPTGPTRGELWQGSATEHVITRSVRDTAAMLDVTGQPEAGSPYQTLPDAKTFLEQIQKSPKKLRIAYSAAPMMGEGMHEECIKGLQASVTLLKELGHELIEDAPTIPREEFGAAFARMVCVETAADYAAYCRASGKKYDPSQVETGTEAQRRIGQAITATEMSLAQRTLAYHTRRIGQWFEGYDALLQPTMGMPPFKVGAMNPKGFDALQMNLLNRLPIARIAKSPAMLMGFASKTFGWMTNTGVYNVTGQPSISLPLHWSKEGLPVGMMLTSRFGRDGLLLQLAAQLEQAQPWYAKRPKLK